MSYHVKLPRFLGQRDDDAAREKLKTRSDHYFRRHTHFLLLQTMVEIF